MGAKDLLGAWAQWAVKGRKVLPDRRVSSWSCLPARRKACLGVKDLLGAKGPWAAKDLLGALAQWAAKDRLGALVQSAAKDLLVALAQWAARDLRVLRGQLGVKGFVVPRDPKGRWALKGCKDLSEAKALLEVKDPWGARA